MIISVHYLGGGEEFISIKIIIDQVKKMCDW